MTRSEAGVSGVADKLKLRRNGKQIRNARNVALCQLCADRIRNCDENNGNVFILCRRKAGY